MFGLGWQELTIILVIALIIFGPSKLPELGKSLGQAISGFKEGTSRAQNATKQELEKTINDENNEK
ncbi:MAG: twin-arginine translocase TatA/TatE family subunit [Cyanobacteria bacterium]|nr:twin-arginine translocase TatA/TatE family subunit [Cyanobacteriota bacterium]